MKKKPKIIRRFLSVRKEIKFAFIIAVLSILLGELVFKNWYSPNITFYRLGEIWIKISFSIVAATFFYFFNQHLPKEEKKVTSIKFVINKLIETNSESLELIKNLDVQVKHFFDVTPVLLQEACKKTNPHNKVSDSFESKIVFENWEIYLEYKMEKITSILNELLFLQDHYDSQLFYKILNIKDNCISVRLNKRGIMKRKDISNLSGVFFALFNDQIDVTKFIKKYDDYVADSYEHLKKDYEERHNRK